MYNSKWYDRDYKFQRDLITIMNRAQKPITIHAGPFAEISNVFILTVNSLIILTRKIIIAISRYLKQLILISLYLKPQIIELR